MRRIDHRAELDATLEAEGTEPLLLAELDLPDLDAGIEVGQVQLRQQERFGVVRVERRVQLRGVVDAAHGGGRQPARRRSMAGANAPGCAR